MGKLPPHFAFVLIPLAAACGAETAEVDTRLLGREFLSELVDGRELVPDTEVRVTFAAELRVYAGCNHLRGPYRVEDGRLHMSGFSSTEIGCGTALSAQDRWLKELLLGSPAVMLDGPRLILSTGAIRLTLLDRQLASPDLPLVGTRWIANGLGDDVAITDATGGVTAAFNVDGTMELFTGCQRGSGTFSFDDTTITFEELSYDGTSCTSSADVPFNPHTHVRSIFDGTPVSYEIEENRLITSRGGRLVIFLADE